MQPVRQMPLMVSFFLPHLMMFGDNGVRLNSGGLGHGGFDGGRGVGARHCRNRRFGQKLIDEAISVENEARDQGKEREEDKRSCHQERRFVDGWGLLMRIVSEISNLLDALFVDRTVDGFGGLTLDLGVGLRSLVKDGQVQEYLMYVAIAFSLAATLILTR